MYPLFFEELSTAMYPSTLIHSFGVNGKISGSVGAIGEMSGKIAAVLHSPIGCGFHYRFSARRRHQPFFELYTTDLTEREIIFGGCEKLLQTCREIWETEHPDLIYIIPSPISDIINDDILPAAEQLRQEGIPVVAIQSELFSHRDKTYANRRLKELSRQKIGSREKLEIELKGCGFTEALYALVNQVMEPQTIIPHSVNIETVGWGSDGCRVLREIEAFLNKCGITVNTWIPSAELESLKKAPAAELNLVNRIRWAKRMKERFGTDYLFLNNPGRYEGLDGIALFYREIAEKLHMTETVEPILNREVDRVREEISPIRQEISGYRCCLVCRGLQSPPYELKKYAAEFGIQVDTIMIRLTEAMRMTNDITPDVENNLMSRLNDAIALYSPGAKVLLNPTPEEMKAVFAGVDAVVGTDDFSLEGLGAPLIPAAADVTSPSFECYIRNHKRFLQRLRTAQQRSALLLSRMPFNTETYPRIETESTIAARKMWELMWLDRRREGNK